ncbi:MAG: TRAP transporter small permease [Candidatus Bathyarchaeia archaeon]
MEILIPTAVGKFAILGILLVSIVDIVLRKVIGVPFPAFFDVTGLLALLITTAALPKTQLSRGHVTVDLIVNRLPRRWRTTLMGFGNVFVLFTSGVAVCALSLYGKDMLLKRQMLPTLPVLSFPFPWLIVLGLLLHFITILKQLFSSFLWKGRDDH